MQTRTVYGHPLVRIRLVARPVQILGGETKYHYHLFFFAQKGIDAVPTGDGEWHLVAYCGECWGAEGVEYDLRRFEILPEKTTLERGSTSVMGLLTAMILEDATAPDFNLNSCYVKSGAERRVPFYRSIGEWLERQADFDADTNAILLEESDTPMRYLSEVTSRSRYLERMLDAPLHEEITSSDDRYFEIQGRPYFSELLDFAIRQEWSFPVMPHNCFDARKEVIRNRLKGL